MAGPGENMTANDWAQVAGGLGVFAGGLGDLIGSKGRIDRQRGFKQKAKGDINEFYDKLASGEFDMSVDPRMAQFFSMGRRATDLTPTLSAQATSLDMVTDPRAMAASIPGMTGGYANVMQDQARKDFEQELAMKGQEGQAFQAVRDANQQFRKDVFGQKLQQDQAAFAQAQENIEELRKQRSSAVPTMIGGLGQSALGAFSGGLIGEKGMKIPEYQMGGDIMAQIMAAQGEGGVPARQDLPGVEDHDANPIDMIAPDGEKVGEATGGEIILNSEQTEKIEQAVALVDESIEAGEEPTMNQLMAVYEAVSETLSQPQFQDEPEAPGREQEMMARMEMMLGGQQMA